jgi:hypothetical protein
VIGAVDVLINEFDLEYHWSDSFRTPRSSNEARKRLHYRFSGQLRRQIGKKVQEMGANGVVGYRESFDIEPRTKTITARAMGTACKFPSLCFHLPHFSHSASLQGENPFASLTNTSLGLKSFASEEISASNLVSLNSSASAPELMPVFSVISPLELVSIGGVVTARSVKLLGTTSSDEEEEREGSEGFIRRMVERVEGRCQGALQVAWMLADHRLL